MIYKSDKPYPIPRVERVNKSYAQLLLSSYAGDISEETAIHQYLFEYLMVEEDLDELKYALMHISQVEMHHFRLLGETIKLLGVLPVYGEVLCENKYVSWNSDNVNYNLNLDQVIKNNIYYEEKAIENYLMLYDIIEDKYVRELLLRIIEDEKIHIDIFKYFYKKLIEN